MFLFLLRKGDLWDEHGNKPDAAAAAADVAADAATDAATAAADVDAAAADAVAAFAAAPIFDISLQTMSVLLHHQQQLFLISVEKKRKFVLLLIFVRLIFSLSSHILKRWFIPGLSFLYFCLFYSKIQLVDNILPFSGFKPWLSCVISDCSTGWATIPAHTLLVIRNSSLLRTNHSLFLVGNLLCKTIFMNRTP